MTMPDKRLFSVNVGNLGHDGIPDPRLRARTDQAALAIFKLMMAAGLQGKLTPVHSAEGGLWVLHIDADDAIFEALDLFEVKSSDPVTPEDAGKRVTDHAVREIRRFMEAQQPTNLVSIERAAQKIQSQAGMDNPVVSALRQEPGQKMTLQTRDGTLSLSLQGIGGERLGDKSSPIVCHIDKLGNDSAILKLPKGERQGLPASVGREPRLAIPQALAKKEVLDDVFAKYVSAKLPLTLEVREVINRRTGNVLGLHLEAWPK